MSITCTFSAERYMKTRRDDDAIEFIRNKYGAKSADVTGAGLVFVQTENGTRIIGGDDLIALATELQARS
jgi:hypothetical protein